MSYIVDATDPARPVGPDDAGQLPAELRAIKSILLNYQDGVVKEFGSFKELIEKEGLPIELGGTGAKTLAAARTNLGIKDAEVNTGVQNFVVLGPGLHTWAVPTELKGTGKKFIVIISGGGGGGITHSAANYQYSSGGNGGLCASLLTTTESSIQINVGAKGLLNGRHGGNSYFGTILFADGGTTAPEGHVSRNGEARGGMLNLTGGGSKGGITWRPRNSPPYYPNNASDGVDGFCVIVW